MVGPTQSSEVSRQQRLMTRPQAEAHVVYVAFVLHSDPFPSLLPSPLLQFGSWPILAQAVPTGGIFGVYWQNCL